MHKFLNFVPIVPSAHVSLYQYLKRSFVETFWGPTQTQELSWDDNLIPNKKLNKFRLRNGPSKNHFYHLIKPNDQQEWFNFKWFSFENSPRADVTDFVEGAWKLLHTTLSSHDNFQFNLPFPQITLSHNTNGRLLPFLCQDSTEVISAHFYNI